MPGSVTQQAPLLASLALHELLEARMDGEAAST